MASYNSSYHILETQNVVHRLRKLQEDEKKIQSKLRAIRMLQKKLKQEQWDSEKLKFSLLAEISASKECGKSVVNSGKPSQITVSCNNIAPLAKKDMDNPEVVNKLELNLDLMDFPEDENVEYEEFE